MANEYKAGDFAKNMAKAYENGSTGALGAMGQAVNALGQLQNKAINSITGMQDTIGDLAVNAFSDIASNFGWIGMAASGAARTGLTLAKLSGQRVDGANLNTGSTAFSDDSTQTKLFTNTWGTILNPMLALTNGLAGNAAGNAEARKKEMLKLKYGQKKKIIEDQNTWLTAAGQAVGNTGIANQQALSGGANYGSVLAKHGAKIQRVEDISDLVSVFTSALASTLDVEDNVEMFENGGSVIPTGALHKDKHHLEEDNDELKGEITEKGIPVISKEENGDIIQHAEIEKEEIILELSLSQKIEKLWKEGTDEAAIEAGKLLAEEIMTDTKDAAGLIEKVSN